MAILEWKEGLKINDFCCKGYQWEVFSIDDEGTVYTQCGNPKCKHHSVYLPELGDAEKLKEKLNGLD